MILKPDEKMAYWTKLSHQELTCGRSLLDLSVFRGVALWWFNQMEVYEALSQIMSGQDRQLMGKAGMIGNASRSNAFSIMQGTAIHIGVGSLCRCANRLTDLGRPSAGTKGPVLLITHDTEWRSVFEPGSKRTITTDRFFHPLAKELRSRGYDICSASTAIPPYLRSLEIAAERGEACFSRHYLVDGFNNGEGVVARQEACAHFNKVVEIIETDPGLDRILGEFGTEKIDRMKEILTFSFSRRFPDFVKRISQARLLLQTIRPSTVLIENEMGFFQRAVIVAGRSLGVTTIALQHGEISLANPSYMYQSEDVCDNGRSSACVPMPDITLVYGPKYKELLTGQSAFPPGRVMVVGNMQFDSIAGIDKDRASKELRMELSLEPKMKLILWTTQSHAWSQNEIEVVSKAMAIAISGLPHAQLIVKQHPMETDKHKELLESHLRPLESRAAFSSKERDIMTLIAAADVVITKDSTTGLEAVAANKPLIVMNLTGLEDQVDYAKEGAAIGVYRPEDLQTAIKEALGGQAMVDERRRRYAKRYLLELDGKAAKRVADIVESLNSGITGG